jgi:hypothetical protein
MANIPKYLVDGLLSVATHNGVHRLTFYELSGPEAPPSQPCVEIDILAPALDSLLDETRASGRLRNPL